MATEEVHWFGDCPEVVHRERGWGEVAENPERVTCYYCRSWLDTHPGA